MCLCRKDHQMMPEILKKIGKFLLWVAAIWIAVLVILQFTLSSRILTNIVEKYAAEYIDGKLSFDRISVSMFRHFPNVGLTLDDFSITYPADRFDSLETAGVRGHLMFQGCGEEADTLASFKRFTISMNVASLAAKTIRIPYMSIVRPRIYAHTYNDGQANWDMFSGTTAESAPEDTVITEETAPSDGDSEWKLILGRISMREHPRIVYTDTRDTLFAMVDLKRLTFRGRMTNRQLRHNRIGLEMDSMFVAGRMGPDTIALGMDRLHIYERHRRTEIDLKAHSTLATRAFGRIHIPMDLTGTVSFPKDSVPSIQIHGLKAGIAHIPVTAEGIVKLHDESLAVKGRIGIDSLRFKDVIREYLSTFIPEAGKIDTDALLSMNLEADGHYVYDTGALPALNAELTVPKSRIRHKDIDRTLTVSIAAKALTDEEGRLDVSLDSAKADAEGLMFSASGKVHDIFASDPSVSINGNLSATTDSLVKFLPDTMGIAARGRIEAELSGAARISQLNPYGFSQSTLSGRISTEELSVVSPKNALNAYLKGTEIVLGPEEKVSRRDSTRSFRLVGVSGHIDSTDIGYGTMALQGRDITVSAKNSADDRLNSSEAISPFGGRLTAGWLSFTDAAASRLILSDTRNGFQILPQKGQADIPVLTLSSMNKRIILRSGSERIILSDADLKAKAAMNTIVRRQRAKSFRDSLAKAHPDIPEDSLFHFLRGRREQAQIPEWLREEDFRKQDIDIRLDETLAKYFREWDVNGDINIKRGALITPYFPLRNTIRGFDAAFDNNSIRIDSVKITSGKSEIAAKGSLTGLKRALLGRGRMNFRMNVTSEGMNGDELLRAYSSGIRHKADRNKPAGDELDDETYLGMITETATDTAAVLPSLIVVPSNLNADISLDARNITYSNLSIGRMTSRLMMKERCLQITDTKAESNMGDISFEGFYSTRSKKDLKTGFSFNFKDITAEKVISLMPAVDTLMPMLKSFSGLLNCELAATADLDTNMNIVMPSINGILRIKGDDLTIRNNEMFRTLAKKLMFRNKKEGRIEHMSVEGVISDNRLEIFPFVMKMDRYTLAMSGIQNLDMSFKYHLSVLKSPFLIKLGINLSGQDFDNMKFRIGKARYRTTDVPVFSTVIDDTKINLVESIRGIFEKGVETVVSESRRQEAIMEHKKRTGYVNAAEQELVQLSEEEQKQLEADEAAAAAEEAVQETQINTN